MKNIIFVFIILSLLFFGSSATVNAGYVSGYYKSNGTYVQSYYRSNPNGLNYDNYSYKSYEPSYNQSYGKYDTYKWNTPSWSTQNDYYTGLNSYRSNLSNSRYRSSTWDW